MEHLEFSTLCLIVVCYVYSFCVGAAWLPTLIAIISVLFYKTFSFAQSIACVLLRMMSVLAFCVKDACSIYFMYFICLCAGAILMYIPIVSYLTYHIYLYQVEGSTFSHVVSPLLPCTFIHIRLSFVVEILYCYILFFDHLWIQYLDISLTMFNRALSFTMKCCYWCLETFLLSQLQYIVFVIADITSLDIAGLMPFLPIGLIYAIIWSLIINSIPNYCKRKLLFYYSLSSTLNRVNMNCECIIGLVSMLLILAGDIHINPGPTTDYRNVSLCHVNVRSLSQDKLRHVRSDLVPDFDVISLSETFLTPNSNTENLKLNGYHDVIRRDRPGGIGGGVAIYVSTRFHVSRRFDLEVADLELLWCEIRLLNNKFLFGVCYRPPNSPVSFWDKLQESLDLARNSGVSNIILSGDLNSDFNTLSGHKLVNFAQTNFLTVHVNEPTRITPHSATCLDQIVSNIPEFIHEVCVLPPIANCDHSVVGAKLTFRQLTETAYKRHIWQYNQANFDNFRAHLRTLDWNSCFSVDDIDLCCDSWSKLFMEAATCNIPNKTVEIRPWDLPWYNSRLRLLKRQVKRKYDQAKASNFGPEAWASFCQLRNSYQEQLKLAERDYNDKLRNDLNNSSKNNKCWWRTVKYFLKRNQSSNIPSLIHNGNIISDSASKAEIFNFYFLQQCNIDSSTVTPPGIADPPHSCLDSITITESEVLETLLSLDTTKASGPDNVSTKLLKEAAPAISYSLTKLFNLSLAKKQFPSSWKKANVTPLYKKGSESLCNNYRPISLLSCTGKVFEKIVFKHVFNFFRENLIISAHQSGFIPGDSTVNQLLVLYHQLCLAVDKQKEVRIVFLDISKAFDKVWHSSLLHKLRKAGITGNLFHWFSDYLQNRSQRVVINGQSSSWGSVLAGVPQGSVLGPLLFLIFINDIVDIVRSEIKMFADDTCLYLTVENPLIASETLNSDLSDIEQWSNDCLVTFNAQKTESMLISRKTKSPNHPAILFQGHVLDDVSKHKHLGVTLRSDLRWNDHISEIVTKSSKLINIMKTLQFSLDRQTLETIYISFIRPILEYASPVWSGCTESDAKRLEDIQTNAARIVTGAMYGTSIEKLYEEVGWQTLAKRRELAKLTLMYKLVNKLLPEPVCSIITTTETPSFNTRRPFNLTHFQARTDLFDRSFFPSTVRLWNQLPLDTRNSASLQSFKSKLYKPISRPVKFPHLFNFGNRFIAIQHTRLRLGASPLNSHLFKIGVKQVPSCSCGSPNEDPFHYFFSCPKYNQSRLLLHTKVAHLAPFTLQTLLYGSPECSFQANCNIFSAVHEFISATNRFKPVGIG